VAVTRWATSSRPPKYSRKKQVPEEEQQAVNIRLLGKAGKWRRAVQVFNRIPNKNVNNFNAILSAAEKCRRYKKGLELFAEMKCLCLTPTGTSYATTISLRAHRRHYEGARRLWDEMSAKDIPSTPACLSGLLLAAAMAGRLSDAEHHMEQAVRSGKQLSRGDYGCLIKACEVARDPERGVDILRTMHSNGLRPHVEDYTAALTAIRANAVGKGAKVTRQLHLTVSGMMQLHGVTRNKHFLEEEALLLGAGRLCGTQFGDGKALPTPAAVKALRSLLREAAVAGIARTHLLRQLESRLECFDAAGMSRTGPGAHVHHGMRLT